MLMEKTFNEIINHSKSSFENLDKEISKEFIETIANSDKIFILGGGRSGLVARTFAMRLMHLNLKVGMIGENISSEKNNVKKVLVAISGSGETDIVKDIAKIYKKNKVKIMSISSYNESELAKMSDTSIIINKYNNNEKNKKENYVPMPLGTSFELATLLTLESMIPDLMKIRNITEEDMAKRHVPFDFIDYYL